MPTVSHFDRNDRKSALIKQDPNQVWNMIVDSLGVTVVAHNREDGATAWMKFTQEEMLIMLGNIMKHESPLMAKFKEDIKETVNKH